jgi:hypothetical protein
LRVIQVAGPLPDLGAHLLGRFIAGVLIIEIIAVLAFRAYGRLRG